MAVKLLTKAEEFYLFERYNKQKCLRARDKIIERNLGLAHIIAYSFGYNSSRTKKEDVVSYATMGLMIAVKTFDYTLGNRFSSYASLCIKNNIIKSFEYYESIIRYPKSYIDKLKLDVSVTKDDVKIILYNGYKPVSIEDPISDGFTIGDTLKSNLSPTDAYIMKESTAQYIRKIIARDCNQNEIDIINLVFQGYNMDDIAIRLKRSKGAIDSTKTRAIRKIQSAIRAAEVLSNLQPV